MEYMKVIFFLIIILLIIKTLVVTKVENNDKFIINTIIRGCARWASASLQDKSPLVAVLHANYASGYLWALRDVFSDQDIYKASGIDIIIFQKQITDVQDKATRFMVSVCPKYASDIDIYLGKIAGDM